MCPGYRVTCVTQSPPGPGAKDTSWDTAHRSTAGWSPPGAAQERSVDTHWAESRLADPPPGREDIMMSVA